MLAVMRQRFFVAHLSWHFSTPRQPFLTFATIKVRSFNEKIDIYKNRQKEQTMTHHQLETIVGLPEYALPLAENV